MVRSLAITAALTLSAALPTALAGPFVARDVDAVEYPYAVHLPDRTSRSLAPLTGDPPLILFLTGSGARGAGINATYLAGYDGVGRRVRQYNEGNRTDRANQIAAEEFLVVVPIKDASIPQNQGPQWNTTPFPALLDKVYAEFPYDKNRVIIAGYSMGAHAGWTTIIENPDLFAGFAAAGGSTSYNASALKAVQHLPIRQYLGDNDEKSAGSQSQAVQDAMNTNGPNNMSTIVTVDADHIAMSDRPWDADLMQWMTTLVRANGTSDSTTSGASNGTSSGGSSGGSSSSSSGSSGDAASVCTLSSFAIASVGVVLAAAVLI